MTVSSARRQEKLSTILSYAQGDEQREVKKVASIDFQLRIDVDEIIERLKDIGAVIPVRCKDCKWYGLAGCAIKIVDDTDKPAEDDYCSFGERKEGET